MSSLKSTARKVGIRSSIFLAYLFIGAGVFLALEKTDKYKKVIEDYKQFRVTFKLQFNVTDAAMEDFNRKTQEAVTAGLFENGGILEWNFVNSFLFCGNVVTTIGYGHIAPKTIPGRIICMVYALFGIPLTGFFLRTVGNELTTLIAFLVKYFERRLYNREAEKVEMKSAIVASLMAMIMLFLGGMIFALTEVKWSYLDSFYFCFVTLTTIGFGDLVPGLNRGNLDQGESFAVELAALVYYVLGLSIMSGVILSISGVIEEKTKKLDIVDPLDAIKNIRIENLNSKALKKLGYDGGTLGPENDAYLAARRGTVVMDALGPRRISNLLPENVHGNGRNARISNAVKRTAELSNVIPPMVPNGTVKQRSIELKEEEEKRRESVTSMDSKKDVVISVEPSPRDSREGTPRRQRTLSGSSIKIKQKGMNKIHPKVSSTKSEPHGEHKADGCDDFRLEGDIGLPSEIFAVSFKTRRKKEDVYDVRNSNNMEDDLEKMMDEIENSGQITETSINRTSDTNNSNSGNNSTGASEQTVYVKTRQNGIINNAMSHDEKT